MAIMETITAIFNAAKTAWTAASTWQKIQMVATAITIGTGIKGYQTAKALQAKGQDILGQKTAQGGKIPVIYGRRRVGSTVAFMNTADKRSKDLFVVYALSVGEVDQIELDSIEINGVSIKDSAVFRQGYYAGSDKISSGAGSLCTASQIGTVQNSNGGTSGTDPTKRYRMVFNAHHGADDQTADPMLTASIPTQWTSNHRLRGIAYLACSFEYDTRGMFRSIPQLTVIVRGKKLYDPRLDGSISGGTGSHRLGTPSTYEWSDNAVLCTLDYITNDNYGKGLSASDLNLQSFQTAADISDELEDTPDYSGSYAAATFSTISGQREITVDETTWIQSKASGKLNLRDSGSSSVFADCEVVGGYRYEPFDGDIQHRLILDCSAPSTYTDENGTALVQVKRFHCNGVIDTNQNVLENTRELLANMRGILNYIDGKYEITLEDTASSAFTVTDDHIISSSGVVVSYENKANKYNKVVVQFFNEKKKYEMDTVTVFHDASPNYKSDDGGEELELVVDFPHIINSYVAYNMGEAILGRSRNQQTISFTAVPELYKVKVGDVITVVYTPLGYTGKLFRVEAMSLEPNGLVNIQAIEYLDIYTWEAPPQEVIEDYTYIPQGFEVSAPTGLTFTDSNASATGRPFLSWNEPTDFAFHEYRINIVDSSSNKLMNRIVDVNFVDLTFLPVGSNYVASVSSINSVGSESDAATLTFSVSTAPVATADVKDDAITLDKIASDVQSAIDAGGANSTQLIKSTSAPTTRLDSSSLQQQDLWADTDDNNQIYVRNAANNGWEKARDSSLITLYNSLSSTVSTNSSNISTAQSDIVTLTTDTSANSTAITNLQSSLATTNSNVTANASNITSLQTQVTANDGDISSLSSSVTSLQSSLATTNSNVTANASNITSLQTQVTANDGDITSLSSSVTSLTATVNSKTQTFIQTSAPTAVATGDLWIDSDDDNKLYRWNGSSWVNVRDTANDGQATIFTQTSAPTANNTGDLWFDTDDSNKQYRWNGSSWVEVRDVTSQASITTNSTAIADLEGNAQASYVLQVNANGKVAQMVLASNADAGTGATSTIAFLADTFKIDNDAGSSVSPFVVTGGTVYIDNARITDLSADKIRIDNVTLDTDGSGNLIIKTEGVNTTQIADRATSVFATATQGIGTWGQDDLPQTPIVTTSVFQAPSESGNTFFIIGNTYINANAGSDASSEWCELKIQRRSASTSGGVSSAAYSTIATIRARGETGEALQSIIANDAYTTDYYYQYRVTLQTDGTGFLFGTRSYGISGIQVIVNYK